MHGDFEHDNFVLKEDDYLRYSHLFRLIETYIRALIAGNVILFLGYSYFAINILYASNKLKDFNPNELEKNLENMVEFI